MRFDRINCIRIISQLPTECLGNVCKLFSTEILSWDLLNPVLLSQRHSSRLKSFTFFAGFVLVTMYVTLDTILWTLAASRSMLPSSWGYLLLCFILFTFEQFSVSFCFFCFVFATHVQVYLITYIDDRFLEKHPCLNRHPCAMKIIQSVSLANLFSQLVCRSHLTVSASHSSSPVGQLIQLLSHSVNPVSQFVSQFCQFSQPGSQPIQSVSSISVVSSSVQSVSLVSQHNKRNRLLPISKCSDRADFLQWPDNPITSSPPVALCQPCHRGQTTPSLDTIAGPSPRTAGPVSEILWHRRIMWSTDVSR